jgi:ABC-2 type transport system ATP-binding protein
MTFVIRRPCGFPLARAERVGHAEAVTKPPGALIRLPTHALGEPAVAVTGVSRAADAALHDIDVEIGRGELVALLGRRDERAALTGVLVGSTEPDTGTVRLFGRTPHAARQDGTLAEEVTADADVLVLDEPARDLDPAGRQALWRRLRELAARGRAVLCVTGLLEEAKEFAHRILVLHKGSLVADGPAAAITEAAATGRGLCATVPDADLSQLRRLPGVAAVVRRGDRVELSCTDSDAAVHALVARYPHAHDIEVICGGLAEALREVSDDAG